MKLIKNSTNPIKQNIRNRKSSILILMSLMSGLLMSCSSGPAVNESPDTVSARQELNLLEQDMVDANSRQLDVLSPGNYQDAKSHLEDAQKNLASGKSDQSTLHHIAVGKA
jgi:hypothetical protein